MRHDKIYRIWCGIKSRCCNSRAISYKSYGGRGITISDEWKDNFQSFYDYVSKLEHFGEKGYSLDRIDNNGNYESGNLRWATSAQQNRNQRTNIFVEYQGQRMCIKDAAEKSGIDRRTLSRRFKSGDTGERLFRPVRK